MKKYFLLAVENKEADITIYGDITSWPYLESDVSSYTLSRTLANLDVDTINVHINSYGGEVAEGWAIYNALIQHKAKIRTYNDGFAASIASVIFEAGDERVVSDLSLLFVHNAWTSASGNADDFRKTADDLEIMSSLSKKAYMNRINISEETLDKLLKAESYILPQDALTWGFATSIISDTSNKNPSQSVKKKIMEQLTKPAAALKEPIAPPAEEIPPAEPTVPEEPVVPETPPVIPPETPKENIPQKLMAALFR